MNDFHNTRMGQKFIEWTMPELVSQLNRLNTNIEKLIPLFEPDEPQSIGEINKQIKTDIQNIVDLRKKGLNSLQ